MRNPVSAIICSIGVALCAQVFTGVADAHPGGGGSHGGAGFHGGGGFHEGGGFHGGGYRGGWRGGDGGYGRGWYGGHGWYGGRGWYGGWGWGGLGFGLPWYYDTYWWDGVPYYYADDVYYQWNPDASQFETTQPPAGLAAEVKAQGPLRELFMYPKAGQSEEQQTRDRNECKQWAATQSGYQPGSNGDPAAVGTTGTTQPPQTGPSAKPSDFLRAERACLEGRNYSVG